MYWAHVGRDYLQDKGFPLFRSVIGKNTPFNKTQKHRNERSRYTQSKLSAKLRLSEDVLKHVIDTAA